MSVDPLSNITQTEKEEQENTASDLPDAELVSALVDGQEWAFKAIYEQMNRRVTFFVLKNLYNKELVDDALQEIWLNVWKQRSQIRNPQAFTRWLFMIARSSTIKVVERSNKATKIYKLFDEVMEVGMNEHMERETPRSITQMKEIEKIVDDVIQKMDTSSQEILKLRIFTPLTIAEIAEMLDKPVGTVATKIRRGMRKLRERLEAKGIHPPE